MSETIKGRRLRWYGHLLRQNEDTPARQALQEAKRKVKKPRGQKLTWIKMIDNDLKNMKIPKKDIPVLAQNRSNWRTLICDTQDECQQN